ncbi:MAG: hypothetical protein E6G89_09655 [Alphaproteobacteria bacterium]|nr:MAG: hypothetical protein E6G87_12600 [Alphaproteobacteria bacterium]TMJ39735.1 MAG: hypothetical protein E6G89_09655 [Alphaproteobacteria bacterium]
MTAYRFSRLAAVIFAIIALLQLLRAFTGFEIAVGGEIMPVWPSWIAAIVAGFLAYLGFTASER